MFLVVMMLCRACGGFSVTQEEEDRSKIQRELKILNERLQRLTDSLAMKTQARTEYDKTIAETEAAYSKVGAALTHKK